MATSDQVQQLYITYFGRPADPSGLAYWTADATTPLSVIADGFSTTPEFTADIAGRTLDQIVNSFYVDLFGRNAEPAGLAFWVGEIQNGNTTIQQVGLNIGDAALSPAAIRSSDNIALLSKIEASDQWTTLTTASTEATLSYSGTNGVNAGVNYLIPVLTAATIPTEAATQAQIDLLVQENGSGAGETLNLSIYQDVADASGTLQLDSNDATQGTSAFRFTNANQTVNGTAVTFAGVTTGGDILQDVSTLDQDVLNVTGITNLATFGANAAVGATSTVVNIENINVGLTAATGVLAQGADTNFTNAQTFTFTGTVGGAAASGINLNNTGATQFVSTAMTGATGNQFTVTTGSDATSVATGSTNDVVIGNDGNDTIATAAGNDSLTGAAGADSMDGGAGADTLVGGLGADTLTGGDGIDTFEYEAANEGVDLITDFNTAVGDVLSFDASNFSSVAAVRTTAASITNVANANNNNDFIVITGAQTAAEISTALSADATNGVVLVFNSTEGVGEVWYDDNWNNVASRVQLATLEGFTALADVTALQVGNFAVF